MLRNLEEIDGNKIVATNGHIGHVTDFYFDDISWVIRYLIVDTGSWLPGREVLLTPHALGDHDRDGKVLQVNLSRSEIEGSPSIELHRPVSRQFEEEYYGYYGWPSYWLGGAMWGEIGFPIPNMPRTATALHHAEHQRRDDIHLRSIEAVIGCDIHASDGPIGSVSSFMVDDQSWAVGELVIEAGHWFSGEQILIPVTRVERIGYEESTVYVSLTKAEIRATHENEEVKAGA